MWKILFFLFLSMNLLSCTSGQQKKVSACSTEKDSLFVLVGSYASTEDEGIKLY